MYDTLVDFTTYYCSNNKGDQSNSITTRSSVGSNAGKKPPFTVLLFLLHSKVVWKRSLLAINPVL